MLRYIVISLLAAYVGDAVGSMVVVRVCVVCTVLVCEMGEIALLADELDMVDPDAELEI